MSIAEALIRRNSKDTDDETGDSKDRLNSNKSLLQRTKVADPEHTSLKVQPKEASFVAENRLKILKEVTCSSGKVDSTSTAGEKQVKEHASSSVNGKRSAERYPNSNSNKSESENDLKKQDVLFNATENKKTLAKDSIRLLKSADESGGNENETHTSSKNDNSSQNSLELVGSKNTIKNASATENDSRKEYTFAANKPTEHAQDSGSVSSFCSHKTTTHTSLPYVAELKKIFESNKAPSVSDIKCINIDLEKKNDKEMRRKSSANVKTELTQGHFEGKLGNFDNKSTDNKIKTDHLSNKSLTGAAIIVSTDCLTAPSINDKASAMTSPITIVSQTKINQAQPTKLKEERVQNTEHKLAPNLTPLIQSKTVFTKPCNETAQQKISTSTPKILVTPVSATGSNIKEVNFFFGTSE